MFEAIVSFFLVAGAAFALVGAVGLAKLPDIFMRLHGPTKATTLGVGSVLATYVVGARWISSSTSPQRPAARASSFACSADASGPAMSSIR